MVHIDQASLDAQMQKFSASIAFKAQFLKTAASKLLKVETNRLTQTLMNITPPEKVGPAKKKIERDVQRKMGTLEGHEYAFADQFNPHPINKQGRGDVRWFLWTDSVLFGSMRERDMRNADDEDIYRKYWNTVLGKKSGLIDVGARGKQKVRIIQRHQFSKDQIRRLIKRLQEHVGRLKAAWAVSWKATGSGSGIYSPPEWVLKHLSRGTPRGRIEDKSHDGQVPQITIANSALGATSPVMRDKAHRALEIRMEAMPKRLVQIIKHPELLEQEIA